MSAVRRSGRVTVLGVFGTKYDNFPLGQMVDKGVRVQFGQVPVHNFIDELLAFIAEGKVRGGQRERRGLHEGGARPVELITRGGHLERSR